MEPHRGLIPYFFELSGEHDTFPAAEAVALCRSETDESHLVTSGEGYAVIAFRPEFLNNICERVALTRRIGRYLGSCRLEDAEEFASMLEIPEGTFAVRAKKFGQSMCEVNAAALSAAIGASMKKGCKVNLKNPDVELRVLLSSGLHFYISEREIDRAVFEDRRVAKRPFFSPISLHPRYARALINLTGIKKGETLLDPFCGTGGILLEAASMGIKAAGSDIDPLMVDGCIENLQYFGFDADVQVSDIGSVPEMFSNITTVVTDPPYGRSTSTRNEELTSLYDRALKSVSDILSEGKLCGIVLPRECPECRYSLEICESHFQRVHRSLTRHYYILRKRD
ncbi:RsmD family RNA methyltransferase [Candidatus Methanomassiliicoccus intestinalis]|uniref:RsmD family RNA methyltransferase n=1 Tax=Candidatus Methanomassiliicoccus intestinalis TaxID=1406512 RepID=UPI0037DD8F87